MNASEAPYGPDRTLTQLGDWLSQNASTFDALFAETPGLKALRIHEELTEQHPEMEHEATTPVARFRFEFADGRKTERRDTEMLSGALFRLLRTVHADGSGVRARCSISDELFFYETYELTVCRDGQAEGRIRHWDFENLLGHQELMEQVFTWRRESGRFVAQPIEMRLYGPYIKTFVRGPEAPKAALLERPADIFIHSETVPYRDTDFRPLFQMDRPPARIELRSDHIAVEFGPRVDASFDGSGVQ